MASIAHAAESETPSSAEKLFMRGRSKPTKAPPTADGEKLEKGTKRNHNVINESEEEMTETQ